MVAEWKRERRTDRKAELKWDEKRGREGMREVGVS